LCYRLLEHCSSLSQDRGSGAGLCQERQASSDSGWIFQTAPFAKNLLKLDTAKLGLPNIGSEIRGGSAGSRV
jgi:hypothetical protein